MYLVIVALTMFVLPMLSVLVESSQSAVPLMALVGKWFVFWAVGVRLVLAGLRQFLQPGFTAHEIFRMKGDEALPVVRELGIANFSVGFAGLAAVFAPAFVVPVALIGAIFYGIAGVRHVMEPKRSGNENIAMATDLFAAFVLAGFLVWSLA